MLVCLLVGVGTMWATDVTYTVSSTSAVTPSGTAPSGSSATFANTYTTKDQLTAGKAMTLTLSGFAGQKITGITLSMKSNSKAGAGYLSVKAGSTTLASIGSSDSGVAFNNASWNGSYTTSYTNVTPTMSNSSYTIQDGENVVIVIGATTNSLFCQSFKITYEDAGAPTLSSIAVKTAPTKTTYMEGETFDPAGLVITKNMSNSTTQDVTYSGNESSFTFSPSLTTELTNETSVSITYGKKTTTQAITVNPFVATAGTYTINTNNGLYGVSTGNNGTEQSKTKSGITVVSGCTPSASTKTYYDTDHIRYYKDSYLKLTAPAGLEITKVVFTANGTWNSGPNCGENGSYNNTTKTWEGSTSQLDLTFSDQNRIKSIAVTYSSAKALQTVTVSGTPTKTTYTAGENFDPAGLTVTGHYDDDSDETITEGITWSTPAALTAGQTSVSITATVNGVTSAAYNVTGLTVNAPVTLSSIAVSGTPNKTEYYVGDAFETAGLVVTGTYSDSHQETITEGIEWTVEPETLTLGTTSVDVMAGVGSVVSEVFTVNDLTVTKAPFETVTYDFSEFTSGQSVELTDLEGFVITLAKGEGSTNPAWSSSQARIYAKGSITVKANNATIKSIEYTYAVNAGGKNNVTPTIDGVAGTTNAGTWDVENKTWTGADEEVTFSTSGTAGNIGFTKLIIKYVESNKITPTLSFSDPTAEVTIGADDNVFPTLTTTPADLEGVTYESSNTAVATIDENTGVVTLVAAGETTITASYAGNEDYKAATPASYTLTVVKAPFVPTPAPEGYEAVDFATLYSSVTTNAIVTDYEGTSLAMAFAKPQSSTTPTKYYDNGKAVRAYEGNTITITGAEPIKYVGIDWTVEDDAVSITGLGTTTAVVTFSKTCRFTKITVSYTGSNSTLVATDGENYYATFSSEKNVVFANATAYTVAVADDKLTLTEVARNKVPAGNAVLIKSATANVNYYFVDGDENFEDNMLAPCTTTGIFKAEADGNYYYKLAYGDNTNKKKLGFWWGANDGSGNFNVKAGGAVLVVPQNEGSNLRGFSFDDESLTTAIGSIEGAKVAGEIFNLQGQRINRLQKGVNIVGGKKVLR